MEAKDLMALFLRFGGLRVEYEQAGKRKSNNCSHATCDGLQWGEERNVGSLREGWHEE
jgi:hypothetical protein